MLHSIIPPLDLCRRFSAAGANKYLSATSPALGEEAKLLMQRWVGFSLSSWNQKLQPLHKWIHRMCPASAKWEILSCSLLTPFEWAAFYCRVSTDTRVAAVWQCFPLKRVPALILAHEICSRKCSESNVGADQNVFLLVFAFYWNACVTN